MHSYYKVRGCLSDCESLHKQDLKAWSGHGGCCAMINFLFVGMLMKQRTWWLIMGDPHQSPFRGKFVHSPDIFATPPGSSFKTKSYLNESQKLLAEFPIKIHISNQQQNRKWTTSWMLSILDQPMRMCSHTVTYLFIVFYFFEGNLNLLEFAPLFILCFLFFLIPFVLVW